jgi:hypothetical protein
MHPIAFRKAMIEAYMAGAESMFCGCYDRKTKSDAREWFDNEYGMIEETACDCCEEDEEGEH